MDGSRERPETYVSVLDVLSMSCQRDSVLILPTLRHAVGIWPIYFQAFEEVFGKSRLHWAKTHIHVRTLRRTLRLWVPYDREPTMFLDHPKWQLERPWYYMTPYHRGDLRL